MPRKSGFFVGGFIDILSLIAVLFLVVTTVTGAVVINKQNANFDLRNKAAAPTCQVGAIMNTAGTCPDGKTIKYVRLNTDCVTTTTDICTAEQNKPSCQVGAIINTAGTCPDGKVKYIRLNDDCKTTTTDTCSSSTATQTTTSTTATTTQTTTPSVPDGTCLEPGQSCQNGNYIDHGCPITETRCGTEPVQTTSTTTNTVATTQTSTTSSCSTFGSCYPNTYTCGKSYGQMSCKTGEICGNQCSAPPSAPTAVTSTTTQNTTTCSPNGTVGACASLNCCAGLTKNSSLYSYGYCQCSSTKACTPNSSKCNGQYQETCKADGSGYDRRICDNGCENNACNTIKKRCVAASFAPIVNHPARVEEYVGGKWKTLQECLGGDCDPNTFECTNSSTTNTATAQTTSTNNCDLYGCYSCPTDYKLSIGINGAFYCLSASGAQLAPTTTVNPAINTSLKTLGTGCGSSSECQSGNCASQYSDAWGVTQYLFQKQCVTPLSEQSIYVANKANRDTQTANAALTAAAAVNVVRAGANIVQLAQSAGKVTLPSLGQAASILTENALANAPSWVAPVLTVGGTLPGVYSATKCTFNTQLNRWLGPCTEADQMNMFMTGVGVQQLIEGQAINGLGQQAATTRASAAIQPEGAVTPTLSVGETSLISETKMNNSLGSGIYGGLSNQETAIIMNQDEANTALARIFPQQEASITTSLPIASENRVSILLSNGAEGAGGVSSGVSYAGGTEITTIPTSKISGINSSLYSEFGDANHMSVEDIRSIIRSGQWNPTDPRYISDVPIAYELPDGTYFIQSGRHRAVAAVLENQPELRVQVYRIIKPQDVTADVLMPDLPAAESLTMPTVETVALPAQEAVPQPSFLERTRETLFGQPKTISTTSIQRGETITLYPGDEVTGVIPDGNAVSRVPELSPETKYYWSTSSDSTVHELTSDGIPVTVDNPTAIYIDTAPSELGPRSPFEVIITKEQNVPVTINRAVAEPGFFQKLFSGLLNLFK